MESGKFKLLMIGALPPPSVGPYVAMERLLTSPALGQAFSVNFLDISDRRPPANIGKFDFLNFALAIKHGCQCAGRLLLSRPHVVYLGISQGIWGYLRDLAFVIPALCLRKRVVLHLRGSEFRTFYHQMPSLLRWLTRKVMDRISHIIVLGHGLRGIMETFVEPARVAVIPNGIDFERFTRPVSKASNGRQSHRLLYLSSLMKRKGLFLLLEALPLVLKRHPDVEVTVAGLWQSESERMEAETLIERNGLGHALRFVGEVTGTEKIRLFHEYDVFVFPPVEPEGLPWVILEAMSASLPVITTDQGAIAEVVQDGNTGMIVLPTPAHVAEGICYLLENPVAAERMGQAGRMRIEQHFSEQVYLSKLTTLLRDVATQANRNGH